MERDDVRTIVGDFIKELVGAIQKRGLYGERHDLTKAAMAELYVKLREALSLMPEITIGVIGNEIAFDKEPFYEDSKNISGLIGRFQKMKIEKISFLNAVEKSELASFVEIIAEPADGITKSVSLTEVFGSKGIVNIVIGVIGEGDKTAEETHTENIYEAVKDNFRDGIDYLKRTMDDISNNRSIDIRAARFFVNKLVGNLLKNKNLLLILTTLKKRDDLTFVHCMNVSILTLAQAETLGIDQSLLPDIGVAGLLHDTGKLAVEASILKKGGKLDSDEIEKMHSHSIDGAKILLETSGLSTMAAISAFEHHVRYDMQGYPTKLFGKKINLASMMIAIADVYDAIRNKRHYHVARAPEEVYDEMIKLSGTHFHPGLLEMFFKTVGVYPPGTLVELDTSETGIVIKESFVDIIRPQVEILYNRQGRKELAPYIVNLLEKGTGSAYKRTIIRSVAISDEHQIPANYNPN